MSQPLTRAIVALIFIVVMPFANKDAYTTEPKLEDVFAAPSFVFTLVSMLR